MIVKTHFETCFFSVKGVSVVLNDSAGLGTWMLLHPELTWPGSFSKHSAENT